MTSTDTSIRLLDRDWEYVIGVLLCYESKRATALADQIDSELHGAVRNSDVPRPGDHRLCSLYGHSEPGRCPNCGATR